MSKEEGDRLEREKGAGKGYTSDHHSLTKLGLAWLRDREVMGWDERGYLILLHVIQINFQFNIQRPSNLGL